MAFKTKYKPIITYDNPETLFHDLRNRTVEGLLSHQTDMIRRYCHDAINESDVALELPTGSGKTLVGLLIGEFRRRTKGERVVYLCPTRQLVNQVVEQSRIKYGIRTAAFVGSRRDYPPQAKAEYNSGEIIAVTTYSSLFNSNPFFHNPNLIILDDAHSAENYISTFWSLEISRFEHETLYRSMVELLRPILSISHYNRMTSDYFKESQDYLWVEKVPTPLFFDLISHTISLMDIQTEGTDLKYPWSILRDHLISCNVFLSWRSILIRPLIPPTLSHPPFASATQRVYMSATLGIGGDLERITGVKKICRLPIPDGWDKQGIGRRFFIFPEISLREEDSFKLAIKMSEQTPRSLVLVPDDESVNMLTKEFSSKRLDNPVIYRASDLEKSKEEFIHTDKAIAILANRLDGIDLAGDECRLLIIKGLSRASNLQEKFIESRMAATIILKERIRTRVIQAIGRCTRSATDYSAICILGQELMDILYQKQNVQHFHPELQGEILFGFEESKTSTVEDYIDNFKIFLKHDQEWEQADQDIVARRNDSIMVKDEATEKLLKSVAAEVQYQYLMWNGDFESAIKYASKVLDVLSGDEVKGYRGFWYYLAGCACWLEYKSGNNAYLQASRDYFKRASACTSSVSWLRSLVRLDVTGEKINEEDIYASYLVEGLEHKLFKLGTASSIKFEQEAKLILDGLESAEAKIFEESHRKLGEFMGFNAYNSEETAAPDPWWICGEKLCIVFEDKTDGDDLTPISVSKTRQAAFHPQWIKANIELSDDTVIIPVMLTTGTKIDEAAIPFADGVYYWNANEFRQWAQKVIDIIRTIRMSFSAPGDIFWRNLASQAYRDAGIDPQTLLQGLTSKPLSKLPSI
jgi:hypothetical protein